MCAQRNPGRLRQRAAPLPSARSEKYQRVRVTEPEGDTLRPFHRPDSLRLIRRDDASNYSGDDNRADAFESTRRDRYIGVPPES